MQPWKECEMKVIKYHVEAADNAKFLTSLEKSSHAIYLEVTGSTAVKFDRSKTVLWM